MDASHVFGIVGFLFGGGGLGAVLILGYRAGKWVKTVERIEAALNGPLQKQFDSAKKHNEEARREAKLVMDAMNAQLPTCAAHTATLNAVTESLNVINRRMERMAEKEK